MKTSRIDKDNNIQFFMWSIGILLLNYFYELPQEILSEFHRGNLELENILKEVEISSDEILLLKMLLNFTEEIFSNLYFM